MAQSEPDTPQKQRSRLSRRPDRHDRSRATRSATVDRSLRGSRPLGGVAPAMTEATVGVATPRLTRSTEVVRIEAASPTHPTKRLAMSKRPTLNTRPCMCGPKAALLGHRPKAAGARWVRALSAIDGGGRYAARDVLFRVLWAPWLPGSRRACSPKCAGCPAAPEGAALLGPKASLTDSRRPSRSLRPARLPRRGDRADIALHRPLVAPEEVTALQWRPLPPEGEGDHAPGPTPSRGDWMPSLPGGRRSLSGGRRPW